MANEPIERVIEYVMPEGEVMPHDREQRLEKIKDALRRIHNKLVETGREDWERTLMLDSFPCAEKCGEVCSFVAMPPIEGFKSEWLASIQARRGKNGFK